MAREAKKEIWVCNGESRYFTKPEFDIKDNEEFATIERMMGEG